MDALGTDVPEPDDRYLFAAIVADLDEHAIERAALQPSSPDALSAVDTSTDTSTGASAVADVELDVTAGSDVVPDVVADRGRDAATGGAEAAQAGTPTPLADTPAAPAAAPVAESSTEALAPPKPPDLVVPPPPHRPESGVVNVWARAFPHVLWLSVAAGFAGQVYGFAEFFGFGVPAWLVAVILGGTFEFMMVSTSSRGLRAIGLARSAWEYGPFLLLGTLCAALAGFMNWNHFAGWMGLAASVVSVVGYVAHVFAHLYEELGHRRERQEWLVEKARIEREQTARDRAQRAAWDTHQADLAHQRREATRQALVARPRPAVIEHVMLDPTLPAAILPPQPTAPKPDAPKPHTSKSRAPKPAGPKEIEGGDAKAQQRPVTPPPPAPAGANEPVDVEAAAVARPATAAAKAAAKATKVDALRVGVEQRAATPKVLRAALTAAGYELPASSTTIETWCREIKTALTNGETP